MSKECKKKVAEWANRLKTGGQSTFHKIALQGYVGMPFILLIMRQFALLTARKYSSKDLSDKAKPAARRGRKAADLLR